MSEEKKELKIPETSPSSEVVGSDCHVPAKPPKKTINISKNKAWWIFSGTAIIVVFIAAVMLYVGTLTAGTEAALNKYITTYTNEKEKTYKSIYDYWYKKTEENYHVSNRVTIKIDEIKEVEVLEVLKVSTTEFIIENGNENKYKITAWLKTTGSGIFTVNLAAAEYIIDENRSYILVRLPYPKLTNVAIDYSSVEKLFFKNDIFNDSKKVGMDEAKKLLDKADVVFKREFSANETYYLNAQKAARNTIESLIRQFNPNIENLTVEVGFY